MELKLNIPPSVQVPQRLPLLRLKAGDATCFLHQLRHHIHSTNTRVCQPAGGCSSPNSVAGVCVLMCRVCC